MKTGLRKSIIIAGLALGASSLTAGMVYAQQVEDPLADLFQDTPPNTPSDPAYRDDPLLEMGEDGEEAESDFTPPRLAPIFAPNYNPDDYLLPPPEEDEEGREPGAIETFPPDETVPEEGEFVEEEEEQNLLEYEYQERPAVLLRGLDKITGRSTDLELAVGEKLIFGGLRVTAKACHQTPPTEPPESVAYIEVEDYGFKVEDESELSEEIDQEKRVFHGWMFASSPGLNALENAIYDVWVIRCMAEAPVLSEEESES